MSLQRRPSTKSTFVSRHTSGEQVKQRYEFLQRLGSGGYGSVQLARERGTGAERVCKIVDTGGLSKETVQLMQKEIHALQDLDHPHIVKLHEYAVDSAEQMLYLVLGKLSGGDSVNLLRSEQRFHRSLTETLVARLMQQVLSATAYCHSRGIVHRDLKPENIMLVERRQFLDRMFDNVEVKVIDFGLAARFQPRTGAAALRSKSMSCDWLEDVVGTPHYMAPEVLDDSSKYGFKADAWSLGATACHLLAGQRPFGESKDLGKVFDSIREFREVDFGSEVWKGRSEQARDFVQSLMCRDARLRLSAAAAMGHTWLDEHRLPHSGLTRGMMKSLESYASTPRLVKVCLLFIATRLDARELGDIHHAFIKLDRLGQGSIPRGELEEAICNASRCWDHQADVDVVFAAANLSGSGYLEYTEFVAACMHSRLRGSDGRSLSDRAFVCIDGDGDGLVTAEEVGGFFACDGEEPLDLCSLPRDRAFGADEFHRGLCEQGAVGALPSPGDATWKLYRCAFAAPLACCAPQSDVELSFDVPALEKRSQADKPPANATLAAVAPQAALSGGIP